MADFSDLERMGRELKCPICLSLLNSSVSLSCNHVFCHSCIQKSMKSASTCPVCKVPYRRREVRPAPHMDNLVSIYKSMEVALGVNIFVTQPKISEALPDSTDVDKQLESAKLERQKKSITKNQLNETSRASHENENGDREKLSFPAKKRVQVPKYPPSQDPDQRANFSCGLEDIMLEEKLPVNTGEPSFTPFFWLRDEDDVEKSSHQTDPDQSFDTPPNAPCFSDIKDSDDELPIKSSANGEQLDASKNVDYNDSEMFEWTQKFCSPELFSSPMKEQVEDTDEFNGIPQNETVLASKGTYTIGDSEKNENKVDVVPKHREDDVEVSLVALPTQGTRRACRTNRRVKKVNKKTKSGVARVNFTRARKTKGEAIEAQFNSEGKAESSVLKECETNFKSLDSDVATPSRNKKAMLGNNAVTQVPKNVSASCTEEPVMVLDNLVTVRQASSNHMKSKSKNKPLKRKDYSNSLKVKTQSDSKCDWEPRSSKKTKTCTNTLPKGNNLGVYDGSDKVSLKGSQPSKDFPFKCQVKDQLPASIQGVLHKCDSVPSKFECAFCHSTEDSEATGVMVHYFDGKPVSADYKGGLKLKHVHRNCTEWAPNVYFEDDDAVNLEAELTRSRRIKCCCCGLKGAALGCYEISCRKSFHVPCAMLVPECRWDSDNFVMLCPLHASSKLPNEFNGCQIRRKISIADRPPQTLKLKNAENNATNKHPSWSSHRSSGNLVLCCSALTNEEKDIVFEFKKLSGIMVLKNWDSRVTHVIASTDKNGACRRTLKFLMGILEGKWILSIDWIKACMVAMEPVDEQLYEIGVDIHGVREGPRLGRLRVLNKQPKLFDGFKFYLTGDFVPSYKGYLHDLVVAAGGTVLQRKPLSTDQKSPSRGDRASTFVIYSVELLDNRNSKKENVILDRRRSEAEALASSSGAVVANNSWVLNSIAAGKLQYIEEK